MFCQNCGKQLPDGSAFCDGCGTPVQNAAVTDTTVLTNEPAAPAYNPQPAVAVNEAPAVEPTAPAAPTEETYGQTTVLSPEDMPAFDVEPQAQPSVAYTPEAQYTPQAQYVPETQYAPQTQYVPETQYTPEAQYAQGGFAAPMFSEEPPKKKKPWGKLIAAGVALVLVAAIVLNLGSIIGFSIKTFGSDKAYFGYVEKNAFEGYADDVTKMYGNILTSLEFDSGSEGEIKLVFNDDALQMAETLVGQGMDLDWLKDISISFDGSMSGDAESVDMAFKLGDEEILAMNVITDIVDGDIYLAISNLSDKYLYVEGATEEQPFDMSAIYGNPELQKALPSEKELNKLINKYVEIVIDQLNHVEKSSDTIKVEGVEQKCTVIEFTVTREDFMNIVIAASEALLEDEEIKDIAITFLNFLNDEELISIDAQEVYDELMTELEAFVDEGKESMEDMDSEQLDAEMVVITDYVNGSHEIIGRDFEVEGNKVISYATVHSGKEFASELNISGVASISGKGTEKGGKKTGTFEINYGGMTVCDVEVTDFDTDDLEDGLLNGSFLIVPNKQLITTALGDEAQAYSAILNDFDGIEFKFDSSEKSGTVELNVLYKGETFVGLVSSAKQTDSDKIDMPSDSDVVDATDGEAVAEYVEDLDFDKLVEALENAGVPEELTSYLEYAIENGFSSVASSSVESRY